MNILTHRLSVFYLGTIFVLQAAALSAQDATKEGGDDTQRIRSRVAASLSPDEAEGVLRDAFGGEATAYVTAIRESRSELELLDLERTLSDARLPGAANERALLELASHLGSFGSAASLPVLEDLGERQAGVVVYEEGCRQKVPVPLFDYPRTARMAEFQILERHALEEFEALIPADRVEWLVEVAEGDRISPCLSAALKVLGELSRESREILRHELLDQVETPLTPSAGALLVEIYVADASVPRAEEFRRLPTAAAQRFVLESAVKDPPERAAEVLRVARTHPGVASLAAFLDTRGTLDPLDYLARDGASAAAVLARTPSLSITLLFAGIIADPRASDTLKRHAVLGLLHQNTSAARAAIERALQGEDLSLSLRRKLERGL